MNLSILRTAQTFILRNSHHILTGLALIGVGASVALSVRADRIMHEWDIDEFKRLTKEQRIMIYANIYAPPAIAILATGACIVGAHSISVKRESSLLLAYEGARQMYDRYRSTVQERLGPEEKQIAEKAASKAHPVPHETIVYGEGDCLFYDAYSGRYFKSTVNKIDRVVNELNYTLLREMCVSLNEFYAGIGLEGISLGDQLGWNEQRQIEVHYGSRVTEEGRACIVLDFVIEPTERWYKLS
jgi:hypothetical protein|nr:MAG TPA: hypothetical protein [Caudoviricetes sp.]